MNTSLFMKFGIIICGLLFFTNCESEKSASTDTNESTSTEISNDGSNKGQAFIESNSVNPNCLQVAIGSKDHTTLVKAVQAAGVENALVNVGPLTVFAPNNNAFDKVDKATLEDLLKPENKDKLSHVLVNHVAPSNYPIETLKQLAEQGRQLYMASGEYVDVEVKGDDVYVDGKKISATVNADNGWVHVIDELILPKK